MKIYRAATVCKVTGINPVTLRKYHLDGIYTPESEEILDWAKLAQEFGGRGVFTLHRAANQIEHATRSGWRVYTFGDVVRIEIIARLLRHGIRADRAGLIAKKCHLDIGERFQDPRILHVTADGEEIEPQETQTPAGKDRFAVIFEVKDDYKNLPEPSPPAESNESRFVRRSLFHCYGLDGLLKDVASAVADPSIFPCLNPESFIVLNLSAIERQVQDKLQSIDATE